MGFFVQARCSTEPIVKEKGLIVYIVNTLHVLVCDTSLGIHPSGEGYSFFIGY